MAYLGTITLASSSGGYDFTVYSIDHNFSSNAAVYAVTYQYQNPDDKKWWHIVKYVGQTDNLAERFEGHHKADCFEEQKANCVCVHQESNEQTRLAIEADLIKAYTPVCNG